MTPEFFRKFAEQCRDLMQRSRSEAAREQLRIWAEEFENEAALLERQQYREPSGR